jgi:putative ABC transport system permease protein
MRISRDVDQGNLWSRWIGDAGRDLGLSARALLKDRAFAVAAALTLALGIGANTAVFSVLYGVVLKPLPYTDGDRIVVIKHAVAQGPQPNPGISVREFHDYEETVRAVDDLVEYHQMNFDLLNQGAPDRVDVGVVSHSFFSVLGISPILGRTFTASDDALGADAVLVLSHGYWQSKFGGDQGVIGRVLQMNDRPHTVVGVLPDIPQYPQANDVYMPVSACPFRAAAERNSLTNRRAFSLLSVFGRIAPGHSVEAAARDVAGVAAGFAADHPSIYRPQARFSATVEGLRDELVRDARSMLYLLLGATGLLLLIASANVANLSLARLLRRQREIALKEAIGANHGRLARELLTESVLISLVGGMLGLAFAKSTLSVLTTFIGRFTARTGEIALDWRVLGFALGVSIVTGLVFGTLPVFLSRVDLASALRAARGDSGVRNHRAQQTLVVGQVAISVVLLIGAGLLLNGFYRLVSVNPGYQADRVLSAEVSGNFSKYPTVDATARLYHGVLERIEGQPGVISAAVTNAVPLSSTNPGATTFQIQGMAAADDLAPLADIRIISPAYFSTLGIPVLSGRVFTDFDNRTNESVAVVNQTMVERYWSSQSPIGSRLTFDGGRSWRTVVGVVGDVKQFGLDKEVVAQVYVPFDQGPNFGGQILIRTAGEPTQAASLLGAAVRAIDPDMPVENVRTLDEIRDRSLATPRATALMLILFAILALAVSVAGITGLMSLYVSQRSKEFGVRMALGARAREVWMPVLRQGLGLILSGLVLGLIGSLAMTRVLAGYLYGTSATDPATFAAVAVAFVVTGALVCFGPAWRATRIDPLVVLRD